MIVPPLKPPAHQPVLPNSPHTRRHSQITTDTLESPMCCLNPDSPRVRHPSILVSDTHGSTMYQYLPPPVPSPLPSSMDGMQFTFPNDELPRNESILSIVTLKQQEEVLSSTATTPTSSLNSAILATIPYPQDIPVDSYQENREV